MMAQQAMTMIVSLLVRKPVLASVSPGDATVEEVIFGSVGGRVVGGVVWLVGTGAGPVHKSAGTVKKSFFRYSH